MRLDHLLSGKNGEPPGFMPEADEGSRWGARVTDSSSPFPRSRGLCGGMAQLARASALQAEGRGFESPCLQWKDSLKAEREDGKDDMVKRIMGSRRMPGSHQAMKDAASCEKPRGAAA